MKCLVYSFLFLSSCQISEKIVGPPSVPSENVPDNIVEKKVEQFSVAFVGDVILHERLRKREIKTGEGFQPIWTELQAFLDKADLSYANLEGPVAPQVGPASGFPNFNYPEKIISSLKKGGFDIVSTANNHALDKGVKGIRSTIENLRKQNLAYTGTISTQKSLQSQQESWWHLTQMGQKYIAWLACTEMTNGIRDKENLVLYCFKDLEKIKDQINTLKKNEDIGAIILLPHWGEEEKYEIESYRRRWAQTLLNLGASAIIGTHPHVVQKIESYITEDKRKTLIAHSLGNFIHNQTWLWTKASLLLYLKFVENSYSAQYEVEDAKYIPIWMTRHIEKDGTSKFRLIPVFDFKKVPANAIQIWQNQLGNDRRLKDPADVDLFLEK